MRFLVLCVTTVSAGTQFWLGRPTPERLERFFEAHDGALPNTEEAPRCSYPASPSKFVKGFHVRTMTRTIEKKGSFAEAQRAALAWGERDESSESCFVAKGKRGKGMATCARTYLPFVWVVNPVVETYRVADGGKISAPTQESLAWASLPNGDRHAAVAYTTLRGHLLAGEERLAVVGDKNDERVMVHILSVSRGAGIMGRLCYPFIWPMQRRFFKAQLDSIEQQCL